MQWWVIQTVDSSGKLSTQFVQASAKPSAPFNGNVFGPYASKAAAQAAVGSGGLGGAVGAGISAGLGSATQGAVGQPPQYSNPLEDVGNFFRALTQSSTWVRVGEVLAGGILLYAGVRALAQGSPIAGTQARKAVTRPAKKVATKAVKVAVPEARLATRVAAKRVAPKTTARVAKHRERVRRYGGKTPYRPPAPRQPIVHRVERTSTIIHKKA